MTTAWWLELDAEAVAHTFGGSPIWSSLLDWRADFLDGRPHDLCDGSDSREAAAPCDSEAHDPIRNKSRQRTRTSLRYRNSKCAADGWCKLAACHGCIESLFGGPEWLEALDDRGDVVQFGTDWEKVCKCEQNGGKCNKSCGTVFIEGSSSSEVAAGHGSNGSSLGSGTPGRRPYRKHREWFDSEITQERQAVQERRTAQLSDSSNVRTYTERESKSVSRYREIPTGLQPLGHVLYSGSAAVSATYIRPRKKPAGPKCEVCGEPCVTETFRCWLQAMRLDRTYAQAEHVVTQQRCLSPQGHIKLIEREFIGMGP